MQWAGMKLVNIADFPDYIDASGGQASGLFATSVPPKSAAATAGLKDGDTIIRIGSTEVRSVRDLKRQLKKAKEDVTVTVFRGYEHLEFSLEPPMAK